MTPPITARDILLAAAEYLRVHGWQQGRSGDDGGPRCLVGSVWSVQERLKPNDDALLKAWLAIELATVGKREFGGSGLAPWNDAPGRTAEEVIAAFERAAGMEAT